MPINKQYTYLLLYIKDKEVKTINSYITFSSNTNLQEGNSINKINSYILINLLIKGYKEINKGKVVIKGKVLKYLYNF